MGVNGLNALARQEARAALNDLCVSGGWKSIGARSTPVEKHVLSTHARRPARQRRLRRALASFRDNWVLLARVPSVIALAVAVVGAASGLGSLALYEADLVGVETSATLGVVSILCALIAVPLGVVGRRLARWRSQQIVLGQAASLIGGGTLAAWFLALVYALSQDTP